MSNNTIFDDVFRTMIEKMPQLVIPLINEAFGTNYPLDTMYDQMRNEHQLPDGEIITDSCIRIGNHYYHIECQSTDDKTMAIRVMEYDIHIALENATRYGHDYIMEFPKSCVLYIRYGKNIPDKLFAKIVFQDGSTHTCQIPTVKVYEYDEAEIMEKKLLFFLPYYILRYENVLSKIEKSQAKMEALSAEYKRIEEDLRNLLPDYNSGMLTDLMKLIKQVADYVLRNHQEIRKELDQVMGGKVLELESEKLRAEEKKQNTMIFVKNMLKDHASHEKICLYTGLNESEVNELIKELKN